MMDDESRRDFLKLIGLGGVVFASGLAGCAPAPVVGQAAAPAPAKRGRDFFFLQLSDTHWGYRGPANPEADVTLPRAIATINAVTPKPDFVVLTGDLTHTTDDARERRRRMSEVKAMVAELRVPKVWFLPGEHDASLDRGEAYREHFGALHQSFDHEGIHFVTLDNVSSPEGALGEAQLAWLQSDLAALPRGVPVVVLAHRPLFDLYPAWDWATRDARAALEILATRDDVTVFYGHIHQEHHHVTGRIAHHAARSLIFPLPAPGAAPKRAPLPWDAARPTHGIGYRRVEAGASGYQLAELGVAAEKVVEVTARRFEFAPRKIALRRGEPVTLQIVAADHAHGFNVPALGVRATAEPGAPARIRLAPEHAGTFPFHCDVFCGESHEDMTGEIVVT